MKPKLTVLSIYMYICMYKYEYNLIEIYDEHEMIANTVIVQMIYNNLLIERMIRSQNIWVGIVFENSIIIMNICIYSH